MIRTLFFLTMTSQNEHQIWILSLGFKNNISADFKAWIMYNNPDIYSSTKRQHITNIQLNEFKEKHNYNSLKKNLEAPWYGFKHTLRTNVNVYANGDLEIDRNNIELDTNNIELNIDWKLKYEKEHQVTSLLNITITQLRTVIDTSIKTHDELKIKEKKANDEYMRCLSKITQYELYIRQCYNSIVDCEKEIKILEQENKSFLEGFSDISSSSLSEHTITQLQQQYEKLSFPQYPTIICPITQEIMVEPVIAFDGQSYEKTAIERWFQSNNKSPSNGTELSSRILISNHSLRKLIAEIVHST